MDKEQSLMVIVTKAATDKNIMGIDRFTIPKKKNKKKIVYRFQ